MTRSTKSAAKKAKNNNDIKSSVVSKGDSKSDSKASTPDTPSLPESQLLGAIDIGSNSFHLIVARTVMGALQSVQSRKEQVQLAAGLDDTLSLSNKAMERGVQCLEQMGQLLKDCSPDQVRIVATYTVRAAQNRDYFLSLAEQAVGFPIEVISGREEARLIFQGVAHTETLSGSALVIDIGGGSTELALGQGFDPHVRESRRMGCVSYSRRYFPKIVNKKTFGKAYTAAMQQMEHCANSLGRGEWDQVFATSGTAKVLAKAVFELCDNDRAEGHLHRDDLAILRDWILSIEHLDELQTLGVSESRQHLVPSGLAILLAVMDSLKIKSLHYCDAALREGILYEMDQQMRHDDIRQRTRQSLQARYLLDIPYAEQVAETCDYFYSQVATDWDLKSPILKELLHESAQLHEVGLQISSSNVHRHSAYVLDHSDLPGYNQEQQLILAVLVGNHRKRLKLENLPLMRGVGIKQLVRLARLLRLAVLLNNLRLPLPLKQLALKASGSNLILTIDSSELELNHLLNADLEQEAEYMQRIDSALLVEYA